VTLEPRAVDEVLLDRHEDVAEDRQPEKTGYGNQRAWPSPALVSNKLR
jgi:hypothetical protein